MARSSWVQVDGKLIPKSEYTPRPRARSFHIMGDIKPFKTVCGDIAGQEISSRSQLREFEKRNGIVQVGSEDIRPTRDPAKEAKQHVESVQADLQRAWSDLAT